MFRNRLEVVRVRTRGQAEELTTGPLCFSFVSGERPAYRSFPHFSTVTTDSRIKFNVLIIGPFKKAVLYAVIEKLMRRNSFVSQGPSEGLCVLFFNESDVFGDSYDFFDYTILEAIRERV